VVVAEPGGGFAARQVVRRLVGEHRHQRIEQGEIEMLPGAALGAVGKRRAYGDARVHAGDEVGDRDACLLRPAAGTVIALPGDAHQAAHSLDHEVISRPLAPRPAVAEARD
jgi:hypothetical protein